LILRVISFFLERCRMSTLIIIFLFKFSGFKIILLKILNYIIHIFFHYFYKKYIFNTNPYIFQFQFYFKLYVIYFMKKRRKMKKINLLFKMSKDSKPNVKPNLPVQAKNRKEKPFRQVRWLFV